MRHLGIESNHPSQAGAETSRPQWRVWEWFCQKYVTCSWNNGPKLLIPLKPNLKTQILGKQNNRQKSLNRRAAVLSPQAALQLHLSTILMHLYWGPHWPQMAQMFSPCNCPNYKLSRPYESLKILICSFSDELFNFELRCTGNYFISFSDSYTSKYLISFSATVAIILFHFQIDWQIFHFQIYIDIISFHFQIHWLFSLLSLHHAYVVEGGRLVGVLQLAEVNEWLNNICLDDACI